MPPNDNGNKVPIRGGWEVRGVRNRARERLIASFRRGATPFVPRSAPPEAREASRRLARKRDTRALLSFTPSQTKYSSRESPSAVPSGSESGVDALETMFAHAISVSLRGCATRLTRCTLLIRVDERVTLTPSRG